jgi:hypothetical protein
MSIQVFLTPGEIVTPLDLFPEERTDEDYNFPDIEIKV